MKAVATGLTFRFEISTLGPISGRSDAESTGIKNQNNFRGIYTDQEGRSPGRGVLVSGPKTLQAAGSLRLPKSCLPAPCIKDLSEL
jgi:hypothetical protein